MKHFLFACLLVSLFTSCTSQEIEPINYGQDQCAYCMMSISDSKFGAELITDKGRVLKYDAAECLAAHLDDGAPPSSRLLAVPYDQPNSLLDVAQLKFLISPDFKSPMGANLAAFYDLHSVPEVHRNLVIDWKTVCQRLRH